jgi:hypothetical protein
VHTRATVRVCAPADLRRRLLVLHCERELGCGSLEPPGPSSRLADAELRRARGLRAHARRRPLRRVVDRREWPAFSWPPRDRAGAQSRVGLVGARRPRPAGSSVHVGRRCRLPVDRALASPAPRRNAGLQDVTQARAARRASRRTRTRVDCATFSFSLKRESACSNASAASAGLPASSSTSPRSA